MTDEAKEKNRARASRHYYANRERKLAYQKKYRKENQDKIKAWKEANVERLRVYCRRRKARLKGAPGTFTKDDIMDLYASQSARCYYCSASIEGGYHIEHMTPVSRGGTNGPENICLACAPCNHSKFTKTAEEFMNVC